MVGHWVKRVGLSAVLAFLGASKVLILVDEGEPGSQLPPIVMGFAAVIELIIAGFLLSKMWRIGAWSAACLGTVFVFAVPTMFALGMQPSSCGCAGIFQLSTESHILLAVGLFGLAVGILMDVKHTRS